MKRITIFLFLLIILNLLACSKVNQFNFNEGDNYDFCHIEERQEGTWDKWVDARSATETHYRVTEYDIEKVTIIEADKKNVELSYEENGVVNTNRYRFYNTVIECHSD